MKRRTAVEPQDLSVRRERTDPESLREQASVGFSYQGLTTRSWHNGSSTLCPTHRISDTLVAWHFRADPCSSVACHFRVHPVFLRGLPFSVLIPGSSMACHFRVSPCPSVAWHFRVDLCSSVACPFRVDPCSSVACHFRVDPVFIRGLPFSVLIRVPPWRFHIRTASRPLRASPSVSTATGVVQA